MAVRPGRRRGMNDDTSFAALSRAAAGLLLGLLAASCGDRRVPAQFPASSAASPSTSHGVMVTESRALRADPPLPGEHVRGWDALEPAEETSEVHHAH